MKHFFFKYAVNLSWAFLHDWPETIDYLKMVVSVTLRCHKYLVSTLQYSTVHTVPPCGVLLPSAGARGVPVLYLMSAVHTGGRMKGQLKWLHNSFLHCIIVWQVSICNTHDIYWIFTMFFVEFSKIGTFPLP